MTVAPYPLFNISLHMPVARIADITKKALLAPDVVSTPFFFAFCNRVQRVCCNRPADFGLPRQFFSHEYTSRLEAEPFLTRLIPVRGMLTSGANDVFFFFRTCKSKISSPPPFCAN